MFEMKWLKSKISSCKSDYLFIFAMINQIKSSSTASPISYLILFIKTARDSFCLEIVPILPNLPSAPFQSTYTPGIYKEIFHWGLLTNDNDSEIDCSGVCSNRILRPLQC